MQKNAYFKGLTIPFLLLLPQLAITVEEPQAGLGLGLYIASQIALSHNGRLSVMSDELHGTTFTFTMPLSLPPEA